VSQYYSATNHIGYYCEEMFPWHHKGNRGKDTLPSNGGTTGRQILWLNHRNNYSYANFKVP
jgi:hypothetical protein